MNFVGVIAEYDPFHNGHAAQLTLLREQGAGTIAVCLSAGATQRGSFPTWPEPVRVRAALENGADMVIALPAPYACASAEGFAAAGVALLTALGCDTLAFGAEDPDTALLCGTAQNLLSEEFAVRLRQNLDAGQPFAVARAAAAGAKKLLAQPNNILAVEYCKAILAQNSPMTPLALPRLGAAHDGAETGTWRGKGIASAGTLRRLAVRDTRLFVPPSAYELYKQNQQQTLDPEKLSTALLARLRGKTPEQLQPVRGMGEGLEYRLAAALQTAATLTELYQTLATKRYPNARLRRLVLDAALDIPADLEKAPPYLHVLGARKAALPLLKGAALPVSTSLRDLDGPIAALHSRAVDLAALCRKTPAPGGLAYTQKPVIL